MSPLVIFATTLPELGVMVITDGWSWNCQIIDWCWCYPTSLRIVNFMLTLTLAYTSWALTLLTFDCDHITCYTVKWDLKMCMLTRWHWPSTLKERSTLGSSMSICQWDHWTLSLYEQYYSEIYQHTQVSLSQVYHTIKSRSTASAQLNALADWLQTHRRSP